MFCYYVITVQTHKRLVCPHCRYQTTVTAGTIFDRTRTPLTTWLEVAWTMLQRFRGSQKSIVVIAIELHKPKGFGRVRMRFIPDASSKSLTDFIIKLI